MHEQSEFRKRKNLRQLCKAVIHYCDGPGGEEIDTLCADAIVCLAQVSLLMKGAHLRAVEEQELANEKGTERKRQLREEAPQKLIQRKLREMREADPDAFAALLKGYEHTRSEAPPTV
jgi:hypothetical protein